MKTLLLAIIRAYQFLLSPWVGNQCRFYPTCSEYAKQAIELHGGIKGGWMAGKRICRCHPWHPGGFDPVPGSDDENSKQCH
ncbi:MAG: membrane protein insertion efficiency factor YidD [Alcanivoracaceae bacterium]|nr:membrane protein insertion efficiency factor YidD [Alcanivoracaceae bacterium]